MKSGTSTAGTKTVFVSRTRMILISPDSLDIRIFSGFGVSHFALLFTSAIESLRQLERHIFNLILFMSTG